MPSETRQLLHQDASLAGLNHRVFRQGHPSSRLEKALDTILGQLNNNSSSNGNDDDSNDKDKTEPRFVEYWCRQEWRHIEAHADVDELQAKQQDEQATTQGTIVATSKLPFRYPDYGHVLYLQVGSDVRGPTCVFDCTTGGDLADIHKRQSGAAATHTIHDSVSAKDESMNLTIVPAVPGRLLRFPGHLLHAVPRPTDIWFRAFVQGTPAFEPTEQYGRSVVLFNLWTGSPPYGMMDSNKAEEATCSEETTNAGSEATTEEATGATSATTTTTTTSAVEASASDIGINDKEEWQEQAVVDYETQGHAERTGSSSTLSLPFQKAKIWLLGNERRRNHTMRTVKVRASKDLPDMLQEVTRPYRTVVGQWE